MLNKSGRGKSFYILNIEPYIYIYSSFHFLFRLSLYNPIKPLKNPIQPYEQQQLLVSAEERSVKVIHHFEVHRAQQIKAAMVLLGLYWDNGKEMETTI